MEYFVERIFKISLMDVIEELTSWIFFFTN